MRTKKNASRAALLKANEGIPMITVAAMAFLAGLTVANLYYNQPLLEMMSSDLGVSHVAANMVSVVTQVGYSLGLLLIIPAGDMLPRRRMIAVCMGASALMLIAIAAAGSIGVVWAASAALGAASVVPQLFIPVAGQFSRPADKARNVGYVISGLLTGILAARVVSGFVGQWLSWRAMFVIAAALMVAGCGLALRVLPDMGRNFTGSYWQLMRSLLAIFRAHPLIRLNSLRGGLAFGSMLAMWACLAFRLAEAPFHAGSDAVGNLGLCGVAGALVASGLGKYVPRYGTTRLSAAGAMLQVAGWAAAYFLGGGYLGLVIAIVLVDIGTQFVQVSNQSQCLAEVPQASSRANTLFMTAYFIGGSAGTFLAGRLWAQSGWAGVCAVGLCFSFACLLATFFFSSFGRHAA